MATKKVKGVSLSHFETVGGGIFLACYLLLLPFIRNGLFRAIENLMGTSISAAVEYNIYYYVLLVVTILIFYNFIGRSLSYFFGNMPETFRSVGLGLVAFYGLNELLYRATHVLLGNNVNLNNYAISAQIDDAPRTTLLIVVVVAPLIEEVLFRGYVFGSLKGRSRTTAYVVSCLLFAFLHVWQFVGGDVLSINRFILLLQYLVPGMVLSWSYDRCGSLWGPFFLHAAANAMHVWLNW